MKRSSTYFFILGCIVLHVVLSSSCANILPPSGGPRDSLPPRLVTATPRDSATNVTAKNITLTFDEYVSVQNPIENVIISPAYKKLPLIDYKLRNVTVKLMDSLEPNTTYSINFGEAIRDVNESNIAKNFSYVFSTGKTIDYNTYSGRLVGAEDGKTDSTMIVVLYKNLIDTAVLKDPPRYYTRVNGKGEFIFHNLPQGIFAVYAVPGAFPRRYVDSTKNFAFRSTPITIQANTPRDTLYAFKAAKVAPTRPATTSTSLRSAANKEDKRLRYSIDFDNGQQDILGNMTLTFNRKLSSFDSTKFVLYDTSFHKIDGSSFSLDTGKTKLIVKNKWKEGFAFRLVIAKDAVADSLGTTLTKADTIHFTTKRETDYGSIRLRFGNLDLSKNPVLQFVQNEKLVESVPLAQADFQRKLFRPGSYELRILYDANKNGIWDTGKFSGDTKRQPETVLLIPKQIAIRANWDNEVNVPL